MGKERGFLDYFFSAKGRWRIIIPVIIGALLILLSFVGVTKKNETEQIDIEQVCSSIDGVGECRIMLSYSDDGATVVAVAVVCEGGDSVTVRHRLTELLSSFYGIGYHRVSIEKMR